MSNTVTVGRRLIPFEHIAFVEPFDPATQTRLQTGRPFQARIVLINRDSVLTEEAPDAFAEKHGFRRLGEDGIVVNPAVFFSVEAFEPAEGFNPTKAYRSRLLWRDRDGEMQSKLLLTPPETVLAVAVRGDEAPSAPAPSTTKGGRSRRPQASSLRPQ
jgi:hypothetical protein